jgi:protein-S-isoprenylcysteine O-methyltransferase Ste14
VATIEALSYSTPYRKSWIERARGLVVILILAPFAAVGLFSYPALIDYPVAQVMFYGLGWAVFVTGVGMRLWATLYIGGRKGKILVMEGPYSICRNPLYLGNLLITLSIALFMQSFLFAAGLLIASLVYGTVTISSEERRLHSRLGKTFEDYQAAVPRLFPRTLKVSTPHCIDVDVRCLVIEFRRALRYVWVPLICQVLAYLRTEIWWPHLFWVVP